MSYARITGWNLKFAFLPTSINGKWIWFRHFDESDPYEVGPSMFGIAWVRRFPSRIKV